MIIRLPWANSRVRKPPGTCATPSITTHRHITRRTPAASGEPSRPATVGAAANSATYSRPLERVLRVSTVGANRRASPSQRTMARPTPSSFADSRTSSTVWATPYTPHSAGPRAKRASTMPVAKLPRRMTTVLIRLHRAAERTLPPNEGEAGSAGAGGAGASLDSAVSLPGARAVSMSRLLVERLGGGRHGHDGLWRLGLCGGRPVPGGPRPAGRPPHGERLLHDRFTGRVAGAGASSGSASRASGPGLCSGSGPGSGLCSEPGPGSDPGRCPGLGDRLRAST